MGQQVEELTCCICDEVKGLNGFSKVQRRNPDNAVSGLPSDGVLDTLLMRLFFCSVAFDASLST